MASPGIDRYEIVLNSVANSEMPMSTVFIPPEPTKYSLVLVCFRPKYQPSTSVPIA